MALLRIPRWRAIVACAATLAVVALVVSGVPAPAQQGQPIKIGFSMALTGGLAPNGKSALLAQKIWEEDVNARGGLLGRPVKLVYYDDQSNPMTVPGIYVKLLDVDKVDLVIGGYGTAMLAPAMPIVIQKKKTFIGLLGSAVNTEFNYPNYFAMIPSGPEAKSALTKGFFDVAMAQNPKPQTVAIVAADQEFSRNAADGARENAKAAGLKVVYDKNYPPSTTDFATIVRAVHASNADIVVVCSYPADSVGIVRAVNEINYRPKMIGGAMVGPQATAIKTMLGPLLNGFTNYDFWLPVPKMDVAGVADLIKKYQARAHAEGVDPLGYYMAPWAYAQLQVLQQAVEATKSLDDSKLGDHIRATRLKTVVGEVKFGKGGEWAQSRVLQVQFQNVKGNGVAQFKDISTQVVVAPSEYVSGKLIYPYENAKNVEKLISVAPEARDQPRTEVTPNRIFAVNQHDPLRRGHALLIANSHYKDSRWPRLDDVPLQVAALEKGLRDHFDTVVVVQNLETEQLRQKLYTFLQSYGNDGDARLFIYYAGHGYTEEIEQRNEYRAYITGIDTPAVDPPTRRNYDAARGRAISMAAIRAQLEEVLAKHILFVFDSCFGGSIFTTRAVNDPRPLLTQDGITRLLEKPARDIITAGTKDQRVPAHSPIPELLLAALRGEADRYKHGAISSADIHAYLLHQVGQMRDINLTPQQGRLPNPIFAEGSFMFRVVNSSAVTNR